MVEILHSKFNLHNIIGTPLGKARDPTPEVLLCSVLGLEDLLQLLRLKGILFVHLIALFKLLLSI